MLRAVLGLVRGGDVERAEGWKGRDRVEGAGGEMMGEAKREEERTPVAERMMVVNCSVCFWPSKSCEGGYQFQVS